MKALFLIIAPLTLISCLNRDEGPQIADLQARSKLGAISAWQLDAALSSTTVQEMRDRAYLYCLSDKASDESCLEEQDRSLFEYANAFRLVRLFRAEKNSIDPYAAAHRRDPTAFGRAEGYCRSVYNDQGSRDARMLGPCVSAAVGADFFGVLPVS